METSGFQEAVRISAVSLRWYLTAFLAFPLVENKVLLTECGPGVYLFIGIVGLANRWKEWRFRGQRYKKPCHSSPEFHWDVISSRLRNSFFSGFSFIRCSSELTSLSLSPLLFPSPSSSRLFLLGSHYLAHTVVLPQPSAWLDYRCSPYCLTLSPVFVNTVLVGSILICIWSLLSFPAPRKNEIVAWPCVCFQDWEQVLKFHPV